MEQPGTAHAAVTSTFQRVLIIEDYELQADLLADMLAIEFPGALIEKVVTGEQALALAVAFQPQLVISDGNLPGGMNGCDTVSRMRSLVPPFKALLVSGSYRKVEQIDPSVFDASLEKPVRCAHLLAIVRSWMLAQDG